MISRKKKFREIYFSRTFFDILAHCDLFTFYLVPAGTSKVVKITGIAKPGHTVSILMRGSNKLMLDEADRSLHDALCVIRCLVRKKFLIAGGGAPGN